MSGNYDTNEFDGTPGFNTGYEVDGTSPGVALTYEDKLRLLKSITLMKNTSRELTLHFDLSNLLGDHRKKAPDFLREALERVISHLDGQWSAAAYLPASGSTLTVPPTGYHFDDAADLLMGDTNAGGSWLD